MAFDYGSGYQFDPEQQKAFSGMWSKLGKENASSSFGGGGGSSKPDWTKAADLAGRFLSAAGGRDKYRDRAESDSYRGPRVLDRERGGFGGELMPGFAVYEPRRDPPMFLDGGGGYQTTSTGQRLARAGGGALSGAATGASIGSIVPGLGTALGAGIGAVAGGLSSFFG